MGDTFKTNIIPDNDHQRLTALQRYHILDTLPESTFDNIALLATQIFDTPVALISLVDTCRVFFKANIGMGDTRYVDRGKSLCSIVGLKSEVVVYEDTSKEATLNDLLEEVPKEWRFYAGAPLITFDGYCIGSICIIDRQPRSFSKENEEKLRGLAKIVMDLIELRSTADIESKDQKFITQQFIEKDEKLAAAYQNLETSHEELISGNEELAAMNEELAAINEELQRSQHNLKLLNINLKESEGRFRDMVKQAPVAISNLRGRNLVVDSANESILKLWGKTEEIIGKPLSVALPELEGQPFLEILDNVYTSGLAHHGNETKAILEHNGNPLELYFNFIYQPIKDESGATTSIMVVATEVTDLVLARLEKEKAQENFQMLADNISQLAWMADETGWIFWYNQRWYDYTHTTLEEMQGWGWQKVHHPDYVGHVTEKFKRHIEKGEVWEDTFPLKSGDGEFRWFLSRATPVRDENQKIIRWFGTNTDITEQRKLEQMKDEFMAVASHELKTPLTTLNASLQLLDRMKSKPSPQMLPRLIEQSGKSMERILVLVDDLLNVNRMSEGQLHLNKTTFTIAELLSNCCNHVRITGKHKLILQGDEEVTIHADEHRIDQVVVNFVNNAVKYAPDSKEIYLIVEKIKGYAKVSVKDNGPGISEDKLPHIFGRYFRADYSGIQYSGLGLGLFICAEIIKKHNGKIGVDSELGKGSTFWFTLPL